MKDKYWREKELALILADIFEALPVAGEDRAATWDKIGYIRAMVYRGILGEAWLDLSLQECQEAIRETLPDIRRECARFVKPLPPTYAEVQK